MALIAYLLWPDVATAQSQPPAQPEISAESRAVDRCLDLIRACQLPDGSFTMVDHGPSPASPVWVAPYFINHAALALLVANDRRANSADVARVGRWLQWCSAHQADQGYWFDYTGTRAHYASNGQVDAHDSSAAMFLLVAARYQQTGAALPPKMLATAQASLKCITGLADRDGLTWAKSDYHVKFLMDNVEVYAGCRAAEKLFTALGDLDSARQAGLQARNMESALDRYWQAQEKHRFAWSLDPQGNFEGGLSDIYPHGLAQLFGIAFVSAQPTAFAETVRKFAPETSLAGVGAERYLMAASQLGPPDQSLWHSKVIQDSRTFTSQSIYIHRPALVVLSLLEGADWLPSLAAARMNRR